MPGGSPGSPQVETMLRELGELWEDLQRKHQENGAVLQEIDKVHGDRIGVGTERCEASAHWATLPCWQQHLQLTSQPTHCSNCAAQAAGALGTLSGVAKWLLPALGGSGPG